ncbi:MAG: outer membrane beta-barrel protein [Cyclobacteriaceae bacterium]|nr:MAG: outer membrane beta-barrel protein [Cyclobacteriaceae bacterium]
MQNQSDQELDDLFKRAAEQSEGDSAMPDWTDMNNRLDQATRAGFFWQNKTAITGSILGLAVVVLVWWGLGTRFEGDEVQASAKQVQNGKDIAHQESEDDASLQSVESSASTDEVSDTHFGISEKDNDRSISGSSKNEVVSKSNSFSKPEKIAVLSDNYKEVEETQISSGRKGERNVETKISPDEQKDLSVVGISEEGRENKIEKQQFTEKPSTVAMSSNQTVLVSTDSIAVEEEPVSKPEAHIAEDKKEGADKNDESAKAYRGFAVKLAISPDYSTVKSVQPDKLGVNYGLLVEYNLTKNISVATGLIRANKFYSARDIEYYGQASDRVDGDCRMWDVPVMLYYNFSPGQTWSLYAGLGASSYLMSRENYVYYVEGGYGNVYTYEQTIRGKNNEWFSMLNLSVGLNKQLNTRWAIQLEPFYKAPLAGVGEGDVSLASFGAFFNLKYNFLNTK